MSEQTVFYRSSFIPIMIAFMVGIVEDAKYVCVSVCVHYINQSIDRSIDGLL